MLNNIDRNTRLGMQIIVFLAIFFIEGCANSKKSKTEEPGEVFITQQRLECMGLCPVYTVEIYSNGKVNYVGVKNVPIVGESNFELSKDDLNDLISSFNESDFFNFQKKYTANISDGSTTYISYKTEEDELKIMDYYGAPSKLKYLEQKVELLLFEYLKKQ